MSGMRLICAGTKISRAAVASFRGDVLYAAKREMAFSLADEIMKDGGFVLLRQDPKSDGAYMILEARIYAIERQKLNDMIREAYNAGASGRLCPDIARMMEYELDMEISREKPKGPTPEEAKRVFGALTDITPPRSHEEP